MPGGKKNHLIHPTNEWDALLSNMPFFRVTLQYFIKLCINLSTMYDPASSLGYMHQRNSYTVPWATGPQVHYNLACGCREPKGI